MRRCWYWISLTMVASAHPVTADDQLPRHEEADSIPRSSNAAAATHGEAPQGLFAKPLALEGAGVSLLFGGWVQGDFIQDFDPVGNESQFKINSIPVSGNPESGLGGSTNFQIKQTRFSVDARADTDHGPLRAYVEGDFFGSGNSFRIRHAYGEWRGLMAGQNWSTFQDISARPQTLDYEGPDAEVFVRQVQLRYTGRMSDSAEWSVALEDPDSQISSTVGGGGRSEVPDLAGNLRLAGSRGHVQLGGLIRQLRFVSDGGVIDETTAGWGLNLSGKLNVFPGGSLMGSIALGSGVGRYVESFAGQGADAVVSPDQDLEALDVRALIAGYEHAWNARFKSTISAAYAEIDNDAGQPADAIHSATSMSANLVYTPTPLIMMGGELLWGEREDFGGATGDATRLQLTIRYRLR